MSKNTRKRQQAAKVRTAGPNAKYVEGMQGLRRSNAAGIHKGQGEYNRNRKHKNKGWD